MRSLYAVVAASALFAPLSFATHEVLDDFEILRRQIPTSNCSTGVHIIAASGSGAQNIGGYGRLGTLVASVVSAIPDSTNVTLPYDKASNDTNEMVLTGVNNMTLYLNQYYSHCPKTRIALMGYSAGGMIVMNTLCGASSGSVFSPPTGPLSSNWTSAIIAATVYGDETQVANQTYNRGTCTMNAPKIPRHNAANCSAWASRIESFCDGPDYECCTGGTSYAAHFDYGQLYDKNATEFFVQRYHATGGTNPTNPAS